MWRHGRTGMQWRFSMVIIPAFSGTACSMDFPVVLHASRTARSQVTELTECCHLNETFIGDVRCSGRTEILFGRLSGARCILRQNEIKVVEDGTLFFFLSSIFVHCWIWMHRSCSAVRVGTTSNAKKFHSFSTSRDSPAEIKYGVTHRPCEGELFCQSHL